MQSEMTLSTWVSAWGSWGEVLRAAEGEQIAAAPSSAGCIHAASAAAPAFAVPPASASVDARPAADTEVHTAVPPSYPGS